MLVGMGFVWIGFVDGHRCLGVFLQCLTTMVCAISYVILLY